MSARENGTGTGGEGGRGGEETDIHSGVDQPRLRACLRGDGEQLFTSCGSSGEVWQDQPESRGHDGGHWEADKSEHSLGCWCEVLP